MVANGYTLKVGDKLNHSVDNPRYNGATITMILDPIVVNNTTTEYIGVSVTLPGNLGILSDCTIKVIVGDTMSVHKLKVVLTDDEGESTTFTETSPKHTGGKRRYSRKTRSKRNNRRASRRRR